MPDQNNSLIKEAIARLEAEFEYDVAKVHHIQLALLKYQVATFGSIKRVA